MKLDIIQFMRVWLRLGPVCVGWLVVATIDSVLADTGPSSSHSFATPTEHRETPDQNLDNSENLEAISSSMHAAWDKGAFIEEWTTSDASNDVVAEVEGFFPSTSGHTNNWAVLVCTSRFWFNYRDTANVLSIYRTVKRLGIPDSNIILMLPDNVACNSRNPHPATVYNSQGRVTDLYGSMEGIEVDYKGYEVTVEAFIRVLTGRHQPQVPRGKRLATDAQSNILLYMTGHGGNDFLKFQDSEEVRAQDLADAFAQMWEGRRYHELLFMVDSCQAASMIRKIYSPNVLAVASSQVGEPSYSYESDVEIGVAVSDRFTFFTLAHLERVTKEDRTSLEELFEGYKSRPIQSTPVIRRDLFRRQTNKTLITDFFGGIQNVELSNLTYSMSSQRPH